MQNKQGARMRFGKLSFARLTIKKRNAIAGFLFISPWILGMAIFFFTPLFTSLYYAFSKVELVKSALQTTWVGFDNFRELLFVNPTYRTNIVGYFTTSLYNVPVILLFSLFVGILLKQRFHGRTLARAVFFLPVIVSSGVVLSLLLASPVNQAMQDSNAIFIVNNRFLTDVLAEAKIGSSLIRTLFGVVTAIFDLTWKSGVQILLFLAALLSIPDSFYEASSIEGASGWVTFWKITFPIITPYILVAFVFTMVESFADFNNPVIRAIFEEIRLFNYGISSAMAWGFTVLAFLFLIIVMALVSRKVFYMAD